MVNNLLQQESKSKWFRHAPDANGERSTKLNEAANTDLENMENEALDHIWNNLLNQHPEINQLGLGVGQLLIDQAAATVTMRRYFDYGDFDSVYAGGRICFYFSKLLQSNQ